MKRAIMISVLLSIMFALPISATIINVPADSSTIQGGINGANNGDTVLVQPGTYIENVNFNGTNLVLGSLFLTTEDTSYISATIIDGGSAGSVITLENSEDSSTIISGFTIQNGFSVYGGGIWCEGSSPIIKYNAILNNTATTRGGGILCRDYSNAVIINNVISDNSCDWTGGGICCRVFSNVVIDSNIISDNVSIDKGGGIFCNNSSTIISNNSIANNTSIGVNVNGAGIYISSSYAEIFDNKVFGNHAEWGGGLYCLESSGIVKNNEFRSNIANQGGGGLTLYSSDMTIERNLIYSNFAAGTGGGIMVYSSDCLINNNTIAFNSVGGGGGGITYFDDLGTTQNTIIWGNIGPNNPSIYVVSNPPAILYSDVQGGFTGLGNIDVDPLFVDTVNNNYHLQILSPCIDTGDPDSLYNDPDRTRNDMGALYFEQYHILSFHLMEPVNDTVVTTAARTFTWHPTTDIDSGYAVSYNLIWDEDPTFGSPDSTGTQLDTVYTLSNSLNRSTRYYWKVLASNGHAPPIYSDETWSFYVDGYPTEPNPFSPANGTNADSTTLFSWLISTDPDSFDAVSYTIHIDDDSLFASPEVDQSGLSNTLLDEAYAIQLGQLQGAESLQVDTRYYWRVRSDDNYGLSSPWPDSLLYFTYLHQNHPPNPPDSGFSPTNGEEVISLMPLITWNAGNDPDPDDGADSLYYTIRLSEDSTFSGFVYYDTTDQGINQIAPISNLDDNSNYFYQVKTIDDEGLESGWSAMQNFWTNHYNYPPEPFLLFNPNPDHTRVVMNTEFAWGNTVDLDPMSSFTFRLEYSPDSLFGGLVNSVDLLSDTTLTIATDSLMLAGQELYWRILAIDDDSLTRIGGIPEEVRYLRILPPGDANSSGATNGLDVTFMVSFLKGIGPAPDPLLAGDANGDCNVNGLDAIYLVAYFKGGAAPIRPDCGQASTIVEEERGE